MRCLVTGASGHLGSYLVSQLVEHEHEVIALVRPQSDVWRLRDVLEQITLVRADLADLPTLTEAVTIAGPQIVFHSAWNGVTGAFRNDQAQIHRNVIGSLALCEAARVAGCSCWVGIGSQAEYGPYPGILSEQLHPKPTTAYGVAKLCVGLLTQKLCDLAGMRYIWLRLLATYGPKDDDRHLIPSIIRQLLAGAIPELTSGEQKWDYLYVEDAAEAICRAAMTTGIEGCYNLGSGEAQTVRAIVEQIRDIIDPALPLGFGKLEYRPDQAMQLKADISLLKSAICWEPRTSLETGLRSTVGWYRSQAHHVVEGRALG